MIKFHKLHDIQYFNPLSPITTAADNILKHFFLTKWCLTFHARHTTNRKCPGPSCSKRLSLTSSLRVISLTVLADSIYNIPIFFAEKNVSSFCTAKATHIFSAKNFSIFAYHPNVNFNKSLTNNIVSFEQLGPVLFVFQSVCDLLQFWRAL